MPSRRKTNSFPIFVLIGGGLLLILAAILLFNQNNSAPSPEAAVEEGIPLPEIPRVSIEDSKAAIESDSAVILDVRSADAYAGSHIASAVNIPLAELESRIGELDPNQWIITYCTWPNEEQSARAARILLDNGFQNVNPILGGFEEWLTAGYPVEP